MGNGGSVSSSSGRRDEGIHLSAGDVINVLGEERCEGIKRNLQRTIAADGTNGIDFMLFSTMCQMRFDRMPRLLCECLFRAFSPDLKRRVEPTDFLRVLALSLTMNVTSSNSHNLNVPLMRLMMKLIFRVYDVTQVGELDRIKTERLLLLAYGDKQQDVLLDPKTIRHLLDIMYTLPSLASLAASKTGKGSGNRHHHKLSVLEAAAVSTIATSNVRQHKEIRERDLEILIDSMLQSSSSSPSSSSSSSSNVYHHSAALISETDAFSIFKLLSSWIVSTLSIFVDMPLCPGTEFLERRYNVDLEKTAVMNRYRVTLEECELLLLVFKQHCRHRGGDSGDRGDGSSNVGSGCGMVLNDWLSWICPSTNTGTSTLKYMAKPLAEAVFVSKLNGNKTEWRFFDFAEFAISFGTVPVEVLASSAVGTFVGQVNGNNLTVECMKRMRKLLFLLSLSYTYDDDKDDQGKGKVWDLFQNDPLKLPLPSAVESALSHVTDRSSLVQMITTYSSPAGNLLLPGIRDLTLVANALFGVPPATPLLEKECITELTLRYQAVCPQDRGSPFGPSGSIWALISADWWQSWRMFVGSAHHSIHHHTYTPSPPPPPAVPNGSSSPNGNSQGDKGGGKSKFKIFSKSKANKHSSHANTDSNSGSNTYHSDTNTSSSTTDYSNQSSQSSTLTASPPIPDYIDNSLITKEKSPVVVVNDQKGRSIIRDIPIETLMENVTPVSADVDMGNPTYTYSESKSDDKDMYILPPHITWKRSLKNAQMFNDIEIKPGLSVLGVTPSSPSSSSISSSSPSAALVPPSVYTALASWYGGGPCILRCVISTPTSAQQPTLMTTTVYSSTSVGELHRSTTDDVLRSSVPTQQERPSISTQLELIPMHIRLMGCNRKGNLPTGLEKRILVSRETSCRKFLHSLMSMSTSSKPAASLQCRLWKCTLPPKVDLSMRHLTRRDFTEVMYTYTHTYGSSDPDGNLDESSTCAHEDNSVSDSDTFLRSTVDEWMMRVNGDREILWCPIMIEIRHLSPMASVWPTDLPFDEHEMQTRPSASAQTIPDGHDEGAAASSHSRASDRGVILPPPPSTTSIAPSSIKSLKDALSLPPIPAARSYLMGNRHNAFKAVGITGLDNLGNTCYLNSSLQALLHTEPLVDYFLSLRHLKEVNIESRNSMGGRLAYIFGALVREIWTTDKLALSPKDFRRELSSMYTQFSGHQQHDAQELLSVFLDGLHEDLNLVAVKPYTELPDSDDRAEAVLADIWWRNHLSRDNSVIQTLFSGQFQSIMTCEDCGHISARYEPYMQLSVPIPDESTDMPGGDGRNRPPPSTAKGKHPMSGDGSNSNELDEEINSNLGAANKNGSGEDDGERHEVVLSVHIMPRYMPYSTSSSRSDQQLKTAKASPPSTPAPSRRRQPSSVSLTDTLSPSQSSSSPLSPVFSTSIMRCHVAMSLSNTINDILDKISHHGEYEDMSSLVRNKRYICCKIKR